ncbi:13786_t:CDS:2, partial [Gigaspora margarita]
HYEDKGYCTGTTSEPRLHKISGMDEDITNNKEDTERNKIALRRLEVKKRGIIGKKCRQKNTKGKKCTIKINKETENYELIVDCKKKLRAEIEDIKALIEVKKSRKRTEKSNIEKRIYIPRIRRNQELIDQEVINKKERKILSAIMNEMDKKRDQKAEFWKSNINLKHKSPTWPSRLKEMLMALTCIALVMPKKKKMYIKTNFKINELFKKIKQEETVYGVINKTKN